MTAANALPSDRSCLTCFYRRRLAKEITGHTSPVCMLNPPTAMVLQGSDLSGRAAMQIKPSWAPTTDEAVCQHWTVGSRPVTSLEDLGAALGAMNGPEAPQ